MDTNAAAVDFGIGDARVADAEDFRADEAICTYKRFTPFMDTPLAPMMLVCRLDAPTVELVENMIDGAIAAERSGLNWVRLCGHAGHQPRADGGWG